MSDSPQIEALASVLKNQFALMALLVVFVGLVTSEAYYGRFGLRYQSLNLAATHIVYRGITAVPAAPYLLLPYLSAAALLWIDELPSLKQSVRFAKLRLPLAYCVALGLLAVTYPLAQYAAHSQAEKDSTQGRSTLPEIVQLKGEDIDVGPTSAYRLLLIDTDFVIVFRPLEPGAAGIPRLIRFRKGDIKLLATN